MIQVIYLFAYETYFGKLIISIDEYFNAFPPLKRIETWPWKFAFRSPGIVDATLWYKRGMLG